MPKSPDILKQFDPEAQFERAHLPGASEGVARQARTEAEREALSDSADRIVKSPGSETGPKPGTHLEAGPKEPMPAAYSETEAKATINRWVNSPDSATAFAQNQGLIDMLKNGHPEVPKTETELPTV